MDRLIDLYVDVLLGDATEEEFEAEVLAEDLTADEVEEVRADARRELWASGIMLVY